MSNMNNTNYIQMLMDAMQRSQQAMPSMKPTQFDLSQDYMKKDGGTPPTDDGQTPAPQGAWAKMTSLLAPKTTAAMTGGGGSSAASKGGMMAGGG